MSNKNAKLTTEIVNYIRTNEVVDLISIAAEYGVTVKHLKKLRCRNHIDSWKTAPYTLANNRQKIKSYLTKKEIREIRTKIRSVKEDAEWFGISASMVYKIRAGERYRRVK